MDSEETVMIIPKGGAFNRPFYVGAAGLTLTVTLSKNGGTFAATSGSVTEISGGWYNLSMTSTDTNTEGSLAWIVTGTGLPSTLSMPADQVDAKVAINAVVLQ